MADRVLLSASQINDWLLCQGKWFQKSVLKLETPEKDSPAAGKRVHKILEEYLVNGTPIPRHEVFKRVFNVGACAFALARDLPPAGSCRREDVESHFVFQFEGIWLQGYRDLKRKGYVRDHKTSGSLQWAKTEEELGKDVQAIIYAQSMFCEDEADESVTAEWGYGQIKGPAKTKRVLRVFQESETWDLMESIVIPPAREILEAKKLPKTKESLSQLALNQNACDKMGGCDFRSVCPRGTPALKLGGRRLMALTKEEALAILKAKKEARLAAEAKPTLQVLKETGEVAVALAGTPSEGETVVADVKTRGLIQTEQVVATVETTPEGTFVVTSVELKEEPKKLDKRKRGVNPKTTTITYKQEEEATLAITTGYTLYVGCGPTKAKATYLHEIMPDLIKAVEEVNQLPHWSLAEYGAGKGHLAVAMRKYLDLNPIQGALVVKFPSADESRAVLQVLIDSANEVVL